MTITLLILFTLVYALGAFLASCLTGWEVWNVKDLLKIVFWPIAIFLER